MVLGKHHLPRILREFVAYSVNCSAPRALVKWEVWKYKRLKGLYWLLPWSVDVMPQRGSRGAARREQG
jgi:hypothetical protein